jgi:Flp pilus assembly protein TadG
MNRFLLKQQHHEHGQSVVEFALVVPILLLIFFAIIEFGRLWMTVNVMTSAAREGARVAAVSGTNFTPARTAALNVLSAGSITGASVSISGPNSASEISATVTLTYHTITGFALPGLLSSFPLSRSTTMHWEG